MLIFEAYEKYKIMPGLQEHQLRVAAVAETILENFTQPLSGRDKIVKACLLHDIGNIIKFNLGKLPEFLEPLGLKYWQGVQAEFVLRYGKDEHAASIQIAREMKMPERVLELIESIGFSQGLSNAKTNDWAKKICAYSDMRVAPKGLVSLEARLDDLRVRYNQGQSNFQVRQFEDALREIEKQIFKHCNIRPEDITEVKVSKVADKLKVWRV
jgi:hypothetical protein